MHTKAKHLLDNHSIRVIDRYDSSGASVTDVLAVEEPLEIRLLYWLDSKPAEKSISITMRTPGSDTELALGFLFTEGILKSNNDVKNISPCGPALAGGLHNIIKIELHQGVRFDLGSLLRNFYTTSSCGVCGKGSLEALRTETRYALPKVQAIFGSDDLIAAPKKLRKSQNLFDQTGGIHAAGLMHSDGDLHIVCEDVGRHNALDKLIGFALERNLLPLHDYAIILSGRASFELLQKSMMAGCGLVAAVGAPSSLAVDCAKEYDMTLIGFLKKDRFNIYHQPSRIKNSLR